MKYWITTAFVLGMSGVALAETPPTVAPLPSVPVDAVWAGVMVQIIIGLFIAAAAIGPLVAVLMPPEPEPVESHDDHGHDDHGTHGAHGGH